MELATAIRRYLLTGATVTGYVVDQVCKDTPEKEIDGTGKMAVVLSEQAGWRTAPDMNSWEYPRLFVDCKADPSRDDSGGIIALDATDKAKALGRACKNMLVFPKLHCVWVGGVGSNPGLFVVSCDLWALPRRITPADQHPPKEGDTVTIRTEYAFTVLH
jgi:hypothetical protein